MYHKNLKLLENLEDGNFIFIYQLLDIFKPSLKTPPSSGLDNKKFRSSLS